MLVVVLRMLGSMGAAIVLKEVHYLLAPPFRLQGLEEVNVGILTEGVRPHIPGVEPVAPADGGNNGNAGLPLQGIPDQDVGPCCRPCKL